MQRGTFLGLAEVVERRKMTEAGTVREGHATIEVRLTSVPTAIYEGYLMCRHQLRISLTRKPQAQECLGSKQDKECTVSRSTPRTEIMFRYESGRRC